MLRSVCYCKVEQEVNQAHLLCKWIRQMDPPTIEPLKAVWIVHLLISFVPYLTYIISSLTLLHILLSFLPAMTSFSHKIIQTAKLLWRMAMYIVKRLVEKMLLVQNVHSLTIMIISEMFKIQIHSLIMPEKKYFPRNQSVFEVRIIFFFKWANPGLFSLIFLFSHQVESNSDRTDPSRPLYPLDHNHGPTMFFPCHYSTDGACEEIKALTEQIYIRFLMIGS